MPRPVASSIVSDACSWFACHRRVFGFVAKKGPSNGNNQCHLFAEYEPDQPASAIVNFVTSGLLSGAAGLP